MVMQGVTPSFHGFSHGDRCYVGPAGLIYYGEQARPGDAYPIFRIAGFTGTGKYPGIVAGIATPHSRSAISIETSGDLGWDAASGEVDVQGVSGTEAFGSLTAALKSNEGQSLAHLQGGWHCRLAPWPPPPSVVAAPTVPPPTH